MGDIIQQTIELVATIVDRFIENMELDREKDGFIMQFVHEMLSPLAEMAHKSNEFKNRVTRDAKLSNELLFYHKDMTNNIFLFKQILIDLEDVSLSRTKDTLACNFKIENVHKILLDVVALFEESAHFEKGISIQTNVSNIPRLNVDQNRMRQVFINLLRNAIRYSDKNTTIKIFYKEIVEIFENKKNSKWHEIKFVNDGIGILDGEQDDIFNLYFRGTNAREVVTSGAGIGLYLVRKIMRLHNGDCIVRKLHKPTEISVIFPKI